MGGVFESMRIVTATRWLLDQEAFRRDPLGTVRRIVAWELAKRRRRDQVIRIHGRSTMRLTPGPRRGIHGLIFVFRDGYEPTVREAIDRFVGPESVAYDVGANIGLWTLRLAERARRVYAVEPVPGNIARLRENLERSGAANVDVIASALGADAGRARLRLHADPGRATIDPGGDIDVPIERLDDIWRAHGSPPVALVKIDAEGSEYAVLQGARDLLERCRPVICCEVIEANLVDHGSSAEDLHDLLESFGYVAYAMTGSDLAPAPRGAATDYVFVPDGGAPRQPFASFSEHLTPP